MIRHNRRAGNALFEFAASLVVLSTMFAGIFQVGYTFFTYTTLVNAVRAGARYASLNPLANSSSEEFSNAVRNMVVYGDSTPAPGARTIVNGLTTDRVNVTIDQGLATVSLREFTIDAAFVKIKLDGRPTVTFPIATGADQ